MFTSSAEADRVDTLLVKEKLTHKGSDLNDLESSLSQDGLWAWLNRKLVYAGIDRTGRSYILLRVCLWISLPLLIATISGKFSVLLAIPVFIFLEISKIKHKTAQRSKGFELDYSALLLSLASSVKTGADPIFAMSQAVNLFPHESIMTRELMLFRNNVESGLGEDKSIRRFAVSINYPDLDLFRIAMILARREGSSLGECLQRLARVTRQRQSFSRKVKSAIAMQKMAAMGIAGCAVVVSVIQYLASPEAIKNAWNNPVGHTALLIGLFLLGFGLVWMRKLASREI